MKPESNRFKNLKHATGFRRQIMEHNMHGSNAKACKKNTKQNPKPLPLT